MNVADRRTRRLAVLACVAGVSAGCGGGTPSEVECRPVSLGNAYLRIENDGAAMIEVRLGEGLGPATDLRAGECRLVGLGLPPASTLQATVGITQCTPDPGGGCGATFGATRYESLVLATGQTIAITVGPGFFGAGGAGASTAAHSISGTVDGSPMGTAVRLSGTSSASTMTGAGSSFAFAGLADGWYTLTPSHPGYAFTPSHRHVLVSGTDACEVAFHGLMAAATSSIAGAVTGAVDDGVRLTLFGPVHRTTTTVGGGEFEFSGLPAGRYTLTPSLAGYVFLPATLSVDLDAAGIGGLEFTATAR
jgi:hypothetical protein